MPKDDVEDSPDEILDRAIAAIDEARPYRDVTCCNVRQRVANWPRTWTCPACNRTQRFRGVGGGTSALDVLGAADRHFQSPDVVRYDFPAKPN